MKDNNLAKDVRPAEGQDEPVKTLPQFCGWVEQLETIYMHYYMQYQRSRKQLLDAQARHWQRYDQDK